VSENVSSEQAGGETPANPDRDSTTWKEWPRLLIKGFLMGSADVVPGVSGGTMALILGIYNRLLHAIKSANGKLFKQVFTFRWHDAFGTLHWKFLTAVLSGIVLAFLFFTKVVPLQVYMFTDPEIVFGLFFGLIAGSIYILLKELERFELYYGVFLLLGVLLGFWVVTLVPTETPESLPFVFLSGAVAICAMILPGISGSYILLILRKYDFILAQVAALGTARTAAAITTLIPFIAGAGAGLAAFSRLLSWLLDHYYARTLVVLVGFLIGSLYVIWPYQQRTYKTFIARTEVLSFSDPRVKELRSASPDTLKPEYHRLGRQVPPHAAPREADGVKYETVKQKLVHSEPYIPYVSDLQVARRLPLGDFWGGLGAIVVGFALVGALDKLRD